MADGLCSMIVIMSILHNDCLGSSVRTRLIFLWRKHGKLQAEQLLHPWRRRRSGVRKQGAKPWLMCADQHEAPARVCWGTATSWMTVGGWAAIVPEYLCVICEMLICLLGAQLLHQWHLGVGSNGDELLATGVPFGGIWLFWITIVDMLNFDG